MAASTNVIFEPLPGSQINFLTCPAWEVLYHAGRGNGKGTLSSCPVLTPRGWTTMGELRPGSIISNPDGTSQKVEQVFHRGKQDVYKLYFHDGATLVTDGDHLWLTKYANATKPERLYCPLDFDGHIKNTKTLYESIKKHPNRLPLIPCNNPIFFQRPRGAMDVDAYVIGLLLGDGSITQNMISLTSYDYEIQSFVVNHAGFIEGSDGITYRLPAHSRIRTQLRELGLIGHSANSKFIPNRLLFGSVQERLDLLHGLMDTDGYVDKAGACYYTTVSMQLAKDIRTLILSLGGWASINTKAAGYKNEYGEYISCQDAFELYIQFPNKVDLFRLSRKKERCVDKNYMHGKLTRKIIKIEKLEEQQETICIVVNNPNRLFVVEDFIVTHNSVCLLADYLQHVNMGFGMDWSGVIFRQSYPQLQDFISVTKKWIPRIFPTAKYNGSDHMWTFEAGETLLLRYVRTLDDYESYHGWQKAFVGFEELSLWPLPDLYLKLMSINRCPNKYVPLKYRSTTNPGGPGCQWLKSRFIDVMPQCTIFTDNHGQTRCHIQGDLIENTILMDADPLYREKLLALTQDDENLRKAWVYGSWDIIAGGALLEVWHPKRQQFDEFDIPKTWSIYRGFDWGSSKPWAVLYFAVCNGEQPSSFTSSVLQAAGALPYFTKESVIVIDEIYGWDGTANTGDKATSQEIAQRVLAKDAEIYNTYGIKVQPSTADTAIWDVRDGTSIAMNMHSHGVDWTRSYKGTGSRVSGLSLMRQMLGASKRKELEAPGLYFFKKAVHTIRTLPLLQYDEKKPEDVDSTGEDHCYDVIRYFCSRKQTQMTRRSVGI